MASNMCMGWHIELVHVLPHAHHHIHVLERNHGREPHAARGPVPDPPSDLALDHGHDVGRELDRPGRPNSNHDTMRQYPHTPGPLRLRGEAGVRYPRWPMYAS